jgi:hypothetical protein
MRKTGFLAVFQRRMKHPVLSMIREPQGKDDQVWLWHAKGAPDLKDGSRILFQ